MLNIVKNKLKINGMSRITKQICSNKYTIGQTLNEVPEIPNKVINF